MKAVFVKGIRSRACAGLERRVAALAHRVACDHEPIAAVDEPIEDGVRHSAIVEVGMRLIEGQLAGDEGGAAVVAVVEDFQQITRDDVTLAAKLAGRNRTDFYKLLNRHGVKPDDFKHNKLMLTPRKDTGTLADLTEHSSAPVGGSDRTFGLVFAAVFLVIGCWPLIKSGPVRLWALAVAAIFLGLALAAPRLLAPLNRLWTQFGLLLGRIVSPIMLFLVYCVAVVPSGLLMRLTGKDPMRRKFDPAAGSYWVSRVPVGKPDRTMTRQF